MKKFKNILVHILVWVIYLTIVLFNFYYEATEFSRPFGVFEFLNVISYFLFVISFMYLIIYFLNVYKIKTIYFYLKLFFGVYLYFLFLYVIKFEIVFKYFIKHSNDTSYRVLIPGLLTTYIEFSAIAFGYWYFKSSAQNEKELRRATEQLAIKEQEELQLLNNNLRLKEQNSQLERERIRFEIQHLRSQINPHFLFNTLNVVYSKLLPLNPQAANGLLDLSEVMRYCISKKNEVDGKVNLQIEEVQINHLINLHKLRFGENLYIQYNKSGNLNNYRIVPLILVTIMENAFKHGDLTNPKHPLIINLIVRDNLIHFRTKNLIRTSPSKFANNGIGMENIRKSLVIIHKDKFHFKYYGNDQHYFVELKILDEAA